MDDIMRPKPGSQPSTTLSPAANGSSPVAGVGASAGVGSSPSSIPVNFGDTPGASGAAPSSAAPSAQSTENVVNITPTPVASAQEPTPANPADPMTAINANDNTPRQTGAGLDFSSLSDSDAKDLGIAKTAEPAPAAPLGATNTNMSAYPTGQPRKRNNKLAIAIIATLVVLAVGGGGAFAYLQTRKKPAPTTKTTQTAAPTVSSVKATDVDKTAADLDATMKKIDDTKEYTANDLADTTLGL